MVLNSKSTINPQGQMRLKYCGETNIGILFLRGGTSTSSKRRKWNEKVQRVQLKPFFIYTERASEFTFNGSHTCMTLKREPTVIIIK